MKLGIRKPSLKKMVKARTTGALKRKVKKAINPLYGKKGMGLLNNPKKALYNKVYKKSTVDALAPVKSSKKQASSKQNPKSAQATPKAKKEKSTIPELPKAISEITGSTGKAILYPIEIVIEKRLLFKKKVSVISVSDLEKIDFRLHNSTSKKRGFIRFIGAHIEPIDYNTDEIFMDLFTVVCTGKEYNSKIKLFCDAARSVGIICDEV